MAYYTFFEGDINIELTGEHLTKLQNFISEYFTDKPEITVTENILHVNDEWKNTFGLLEEIILYIEEHGKLLSGKILGYGENTSDRWEIEIINEKPFRCETGDVMTLGRAERNDEQLENDTDLYRLKTVLNEELIL